jgi:site-specific DNA-methyltransferase (adenine-specific)
MKDYNIMEIYNDDCFNILGTIKDKIDLVLVDLPYGQTDLKWDVKIDLDRMWDELKKICKDNCIYVFFTTVKFGNELINSNRKWFRYDMVWIKNKTLGFLNCNKMPLRSHEMIYVFYKKRGTYNPQKVKGKLYKGRQEGYIENSIYGKKVRKETPNSTSRYPKSYIKVDKEEKIKHHTAKPVKLCEWLVKTYSNEYEVVLDFTMGSGSTGIACKNTNRRFIGVEKDKEIFEYAKSRLCAED